MFHCKRIIFLHFIRFCSGCGILLRHYHFFRNHSFNYFCFHWYRHDAITGYRCRAYRHSRKQKRAHQKQCNPFRQFFVSHLLFPPFSFALEKLFSLYLHVKSNVTMRQGNILSLLFCDITNSVCLSVKIIPFLICPVNPSNI